MVDSTKKPFARRYGKIYNFAQPYNDVGLTETAVLSYLSFRAGKKEICWPSQKTIAEDLGIKCIRTLTRAIARLRASGAIETDWKMVGGRKCYVYRIKSDESTPRSSCTMQYGYIYADQIQQQSGLSSGARGLLGHIVSKMGRKTELVTRRSSLCEELKITCVTLRKYIKELSESCLSIQTTKRENTYYLRISILFFDAQGDKKVPEKKVTSNKTKTYKSVDSLVLNNKTKRHDANTKNGNSPLQTRIGYWQIPKDWEDPQKVLAEQTKKEGLLYEMYKQAVDYASISAQIGKQMSQTWDKSDMSIIVAYDMYRFMSRFKEIPAAWLLDKQLIRSLVNALFGAQVKTKADKETLRALEYSLCDASGRDILQKIQSEIFVFKKKTAVIYKNLTEKMEKGMAGKEIRNKIGYKKACIRNYFTESNEWKDLSTANDLCEEPQKLRLPDTFEAFLDEPHMQMYRDALCSLPAAEYQRHKAAYESLSDKNPGSVYMDAEYEWIWCVLPDTFTGLLNIISPEDRRQIFGLPKAQYQARKTAYEKLSEEDKREVLWGEFSWILDTAEQRDLCETA